MNGVVKGMLFMLLIVYIVSPADLFPGPIDDAIMTLLYFASSKRKIVDKDVHYEEVEYDE